MEKQQRCAMLSKTKFRKKKGELEFRKIIVWVLLLALLIWTLIFFDGIREAILGLFGSAFEMTR